MKWDHTLSQSIRLGHVPGDLRKAIELAKRSPMVAVRLRSCCPLLLASKPPRQTLDGRRHDRLEWDCRQPGEALFTRARPYTYDPSHPQANATNRSRRNWLGVSWQRLVSGMRPKRVFRGPYGHGLGAGDRPELDVSKATVILCCWRTLATFQRILSGAHFPSDAMAGVLESPASCALWFSEYSLEPDRMREPGE